MRAFVFHDDHRAFHLSWHGEDMQVLQSINTSCVAPEQKFKIKQSERDKFLKLACQNWGFEWNE